MAKHPDVDAFLEGAAQWQKEMKALRTLLLKTPLTEDFKWGKPCYSFGGKNVVIMQPFKACLGLMFFRGAELSDSLGLLVDNGPHSQSAKRMEFMGAKDVAQGKDALLAYIEEALRLEESGRAHKPARTPEALPPELQAAFKASPAFAIAFQALTPGRQRAYVLHISNAKASATRVARIEKCRPRILAGLGLNDR